MRQYAIMSNRPSLDSEHAAAPAPVAGDGNDSRAPYAAPRLLKKRAVARVTLFSGGGAAGGITITPS